MTAFRLGTLVTCAALAPGVLIGTNRATANDQTSLAATRTVINLRPTFDGGIVDNSPFDGRPDFFDATVHGGVTLNSGLHDSREIVEFDLNILPEGAQIRRAELRVRIIGRSVGQDATSLPIEVRAFRGNGVLDLGDFHQGRFEGVFDGLPIPINGAGTVDVFPTVSNIYANSPRRLVAFVLRTTGRGGVTVGSLETDRPAILSIIYAIPE
jgi:hypothetical protein